MKNNKTEYLIIFSILTITAFLLFNCAAKKAMWGDEKTGFILTYRLDSAQKLTYNTSGTQEQNMEMMGQAMESETNFSSKYTLNGAGLNDENNLVCKVTIDDMSIKSNSAMAGEINPDLSKVKGKGFDLTFSLHGKELDWGNAKDIKYDLGQMAGGEQSIENSFRDVFPNLPNIPVKIGDTWNEKDEQTVPQGNLEIKTITDATHKLVGYETVDGYECLKIHTKAKGTLEGTGEQMGAQLDMEGDLETESTWYFAYKQGIFVKSNSDVFMEGTVAVSGPQDMTIPMTQTTKAEIKLVTPPPPQPK